MKHFYLLLGLFCFSEAIFSQTISGNVNSEADGALIGATIQLKGTSKGTVTDFEGNYSLELDELSGILVVSYIGYQTQEVDINGRNLINITLSQGQELDEVVVLGSRAPARTNTESPVPVDVINVSNLVVEAPQTTLNQLLHYSAPSFNSNTQTISDGTDHIDPASLRGLGPDQVLVLVNGKRRHTSSLVNVNGTFGRGSVGTDLNAIPADGLRTIEVLRDGAAAQYGSDAIAGVINLNLNRSVNKLSIRANMGANYTSENSPRADVDGKTYGIGVNYGLPLGDQGGFINMTGTFDQRGWTDRMLEWEGSIFNGYNAVEWVANQDGFDISKLANDVEAIKQYGGQVSHFSSDVRTAISEASTIDDLRTALDIDVTESELNTRGMQRSDFNMRVGQSATRGGKFFANMEIPVSEGFAFYSFGGLSYTRGESGCFYRLPNQNRTYTPTYINGFLPLINSNVNDKSIVVGLKGKAGEWNVDLSNAYGSNEFTYEITQTHNASLQASSPTEFNAGGHLFRQNTANVDLSRYF